MSKFTAQLSRSPIIKTFHSPTDFWPQAPMSLQELVRLLNAQRSPLIIFMNRGRFPKTV